MSPLLRHLPAVESLRRRPPLADLPDTTAVLLARESLAEVRAAIARGALDTPEAVAATLADALAARVRRLTGPSLRRVVNGTGVLLHTNAGRAPLPPVAVEALAATASGYCNLEFSLADGRRASRQDHVRPLLQWLTGAEDALVVNNGAAAVLLALHGLALGQRVLVSRGELVEIGGGFRIPDVMQASGATLLEVGTTNRTHLRDYERPLAQDHQHTIGALLQVHRSNFAVVGFTKTPGLAELAALAHSHGKPLLVDAGSGALGGLDGTLHTAFEREPQIREVLRAGADLVLFSGDKLVGGPQAGILVGKSALVQRLAADPLARALRVDNLTLAALEQVLRLHLLGRAHTELPVLAAVAEPESALAQWLDVLAAQLAAELPGWRVVTAAAEAQLGGGSDPLVRLPSRALVISHPDRSGTSLQASALRASVPVLGRVRGDDFWLDGRSLRAGATDVGPADLARTIAAACRA